MHRIALFLLVAALWLAALSTHAQTEGEGESETEALARRATDPTSSPLSFGFINDFGIDYRDLADGTPIDETGYSLRFQPVVPFTAFGIFHIFRMTIPYDVTGPSPEGLGPVTFFDLLVLPQSWGRLGVGVVGSLAPAGSGVADRFTIGPAIGAVIRMSKTLNVGLFNQNLFAGHTALSQLQPIAAYQLGDGWSLSLGDLQWMYDWNRKEILSMPLGLQLGKVQPVAGQPMRFSINPQYDLKDMPGNTRFKLLLTITLLLPDGKK